MLRVVDPAQGWEEQGQEQQERVHLELELELEEEELVGRPLRRCSTRRPSEFCGYNLVVLSP